MANVQIVAYGLALAAIGGTGFGWLKSHDSSIRWQALAEARLEQIKDSSKTTDSLRATLDSTRIALKAVLAATKQRSDSLERVAQTERSKAQALAVRLRSALPDSLKAVFDTASAQVGRAMAALSQRVVEEQMAKTAALEQITRDSVVITRLTQERNSLIEISAACIKRTKPALKDRITQMAVIGLGSLVILNKFGAIHILDSRQN